MKKPARYAWLLFALATLAYIPVPFHRFSPAIVAADIMKEMGLSAPAMGVLASSFFVVYGIMQMPGGLLVDGLGSRVLMPLMVGFSGLGALCFGMADSFWLALLGRSAIGFGASITFLCGMQIIGQYFPVQQFGRLSGLFLGMGGVGLFLAFGPLAALCLAVGRETAFVLCGVTTSGLALLMAFLMRGAPERSAKTAGFGLMKRNLRVVMTRRDFWFACVWLFAQSNLHMSFGGLWGGTFLMDVRGLSQTEAGQLLSFSAAGVIVGGLLSGWLCDVVFGSPRTTMLFCGVIATGNFVVLALFGNVLPLWGLGLWFMIMTTFGVPAGAPSFAAMRRLFGDQATASACGLLGCLPAMGVLVLQPLTGYVLEVCGRTSGGGFSPEGYAAVCWIFVAVGGLGVAGAFCMRDASAPHVVAETTP